MGTLKRAGNTPNTAISGNRLKDSNFSLVNIKYKDKYRVNDTVEIAPYRQVADLGIFFRVIGSEFQGLLHNKNIPDELDKAASTLIKNQSTLLLKIIKFNKLTDGRVEFGYLDTEDNRKAIAGANLDMTPYQFTMPAQREEVHQTLTFGEAEVAPVAEIVEEVLKPMTTLDDRLEREFSDMKYFLEGVLKEPLSEKAANLLREIVKDSNMFRLFMAMQDAVDNRDDKGLNLVAMIKLHYSGKGA